MKGWDPDHRPPQPARRVATRWTGAGLVRLELTVVVPDIAIAGRSDFIFSVLEDPATHAWVGEDPEHPGSYQAAIDKTRALMATPELVAVLREVAAVGHRALVELSDAAAGDSAARFRELALDAIATLPRPTPSDLAIDVGRAALGFATPPATWSRTQAGVRLSTIADEGDPLGWVDQWSSVEELLVADGPESSAVVERLAETVRQRPDLRPRDMRAEARRSAIEYLERLAPELLPLVEPAHVSEVVPPAVASRTDPLTGLWNARAKGYFAPAEVAPWLASMPGDAVFLMLDLRQFKAVNDDRGKAFGDAFLAEVGRRLKATASPWPVFRLGSDEFLVATRQSNEAEIQAFARTIRSEVERPFDGVIVQTWAAAAQAFPGESSEQLFRAVDRALVAASQNGWKELMIAPPGTDGSTWFDRPDPHQ